MALKIFERYDPLATAPSAEYPTGSVKNRTSQGIPDGTPLEKDWANDLLGMRDAILAAGNVTANGDVETATNSQVVQALNNIYARLGEDAGFTKNLTVDGETTLKDDVFIEKDLTVDGETTLKDDVFIEKDLTVDGEVSFNSVPKITNESLVLSSWLGPHAMFKEDAETPVFLKTGPNSLSLKAGTVFALDKHLVRFDTDTALTMPVMDKGTDYAIWLNTDLSIDVVKDEFNNPSAAPDPKSRKIGGFHYGLVDELETVAGGGFSTSGVTNAGGSMAWAQDDVDLLAGINAFSLWDPLFRCKGEQRGMVFEPKTQTWWAAYFMSTDPDSNGPSRYNTDIASGTVLPYVPRAWGGNGTLKYAELRSWEAHEMCTAFGLRLPTYEEFICAAFGVTEGQSLGGSSVTPPATKREPGYTSHIGLEQATGHAYVIAGPMKANGGSSWSGNGRGSWYGSAGLVLLGGTRSSAAHSGSRSATFYGALSYSFWDSCVRAVGDHLNLAKQHGSAA